MRGKDYRDNHMWQGLWGYSHVARTIGILTCDLFSSKYCTSYIYILYKCTYTLHMYNTWLDWASVLETVNVGESYFVNYHAGNMSWERKVNVVVFHPLYCVPCNTLQWHFFVENRTWPMGTIYPKSLHYSSLLCYRMTRLVI